MQVCTIASGSSGNSTYVGIGGEHFLVDAGISGKRIEHCLQGLNIRNLSGIFITHEHRDHITGAGVMARRFKVEIYATPFTWRYFLRHGSIGELDEKQIKVIEPEKPIKIGGAVVSAFDIPHDAAQPVGYSFTAFDSALGRTEKTAVATDLGYATDIVREHLKGAQIIVLESNHDPEMLERGSYHRKLKDRVASNRGHLSNAAAGLLLTEVAGAEYVILAHLSDENNRPMLAFDTVKRILDGNGVRVKDLIVADRAHPGELVCYGG